MTSAGPHHLLGALLAVLGRRARFQIDSRPGDRERSVTTAAAWPCGCRAEGSSYHSLVLTACAAHTVLPNDDPSADSRRSAGSV